MAMLLKSYIVCRLIEITNTNNIFNNFDRLAIII
ncbi:hypothetical protein SVI_2326 [Shewanella violacea DSS12]|uniref:Uncharacterized protein n=1 Tax=Shewanella violacea (strain JCM 10179 / CIP 106290 / LMG 19151 / DSS12) TaxID=637905 RepID=D4ZKU8_SHEVD|nr:hypothetical protein SVI_2326 [Shewanella violacea DSS12]